MANWSKHTPLGAILASLACAGACGGSSELTFSSEDAGPDAAGTGTGGSSGSSGSAGANGSSGSAGSAGRGGSSGSAGSGGAGAGGTLGAAGTAGSSGSGGTGGTAGTGGGGSCPAAQPSPNTACAPDGLSCHYGECCPTTANCKGGRWQVLVPPCAQPVCPNEVPTNGDDCSVCIPSPCRYDRCGSDNVVRVATCNAQTKKWVVLATACGTACGPDGRVCKSDELCVRSSGGIGFSYSCQKNPCSPNPVTCDCAAPLCGGFTCSSASEHQVDCVCLVCV
jgi:hypothetical protein